MRARILCSTVAILGALAGCSSSGGGSQTGSGGTPSTGGYNGSGGSGDGGSGGSDATGGATGSGGTPGTGGAISTGGTVQRRHGRTHQHGRFGGDGGHFVDWWHDRYGWHHRYGRHDPYGRHDRYRRGRGRRGHEQRYRRRYRGDDGGVPGSLRPGCHRRPRYLLRYRCSCPRRPRPRLYRSHAARYGSCRRTDGATHYDQCHPIDEFPHRTARVLMSGPAARDSAPGGDRATWCRGAARAGRFHRWRRSRPSHPSPLPPDRLASAGGWRTAASCLRPAAAAAATSRAGRMGRVERGTASSHFVFSSGVKGGDDFGTKAGSRARGADVKRKSSEEQPLMSIDARHCVPLSPKHLRDRVVVHSVTKNSLPNVAVTPARETQPSILASQTRRRGARPPHGVPFGHLGEDSLRAARVSEIVGGRAAGLGHARRVSSVLSILLMPDTDASPPLPSWLPPGCAPLPTTMYCPFLK